MLRPTGRGKIRELLLPAQDSATTFHAVLYNFDIDGEALKLEHRSWLTEHVVPQLGNPSVKIGLRGEASRTGSDAYNLALSKRRVNQVLHFLKQNGPVLATIEDTAVGEADAAGRGEDDNTEDEMVRAVIVKVEQSLHRLVPVVFDRARQSGINDGFDDGADPPWVMIPAEHPTRLMQVENAEGLSLVSSNPGVAFPQPALFPLPGPVKINRQTQIFRIVGGVNGDAEIRAVDAAGRIHARLAVSVLPKLTVRCAFHYVRNARYGSRTRNRGDEANFLGGLNENWLPQANIEFVQVPGNVSEPDLVMTEDLGDRIDTDPKFDTVASAKHRDPNAQFNVFFVREVELNSSVVGDGVDGETRLGPPGDCLFEDDAPDERATIAHEAGHCLTLDHNSPIPSTKIMLMHPTSDGRFLPRVHVLQARRAVRK
jgi:hypothetical protein